MDCGESSSAIAIVSPSSLESFEKWVLDNGGDSEFVTGLKSAGFTSKLALKKFDFNCKDGEETLKKFPYGKQCLLKALVERLIEEDCGSSSTTTTKGTATYSSVATKAAALGKGSTSIKDKLGKLFHFPQSTKGAVTSVYNDDDEDFEPKPCFSSRGKKSFKRKGTEVFKGSSGSGKRKVKQTVVTIVGLSNNCTRTPTGKNRAALTREIWVNSGASEEVVRNKIANAFDWDNPSGIQFLFAQGRNLRTASLSDVENSQSWDLDTIKVLMGSGALYVVKPTMSTSVDNQDILVSTVSHNAIHIHVITENF